MRRRLAATLAPVTPTVVAPEPASRHDVALCEALRGDPLYDEEGARRRTLYVQASSDADFRKRELEKCAADVVYWVTNYGWTVWQKRQHGAKTVPFVPFPKQVEAFRWLEQCEKDNTECVWEKSRDVGATWIVIAFMVHRLLFGPEDWEGGVGSRKEEYVDKIGAPKSILEKGRIIIRNLPDWMRPKGYVERIHAPRMRIVNPERRSGIFGEAGRNIGRGGRSSFYLIDEAAFLEDPAAADASLSENAEVKCWLSTPNGIGNAFYAKRKSGDYPVFRLHYSDDPRKTPEEMAAKKHRYRYDPALYAQEYEIDYAASVENVVIPLVWLEACVKYESSGNGPVFAGADVGAGSKGGNVYLARRGVKVTRIEESSEPNSIKQAGWLRDLALADSAERLCVDAPAVGIGVTSALTAMHEDRALPFEMCPVSTGNPASDDLWDDNRPGRERFINIRAEEWWRMRIRAEKTYEVVNGLAEHPEDELLDLPDDQDLLDQLASPLYFRVGTGSKIRIESKEEMRDRNVRSPHKADALILSFYLPPAKGWTGSAKELLGLYQ